MRVAKLKNRPLLAAISLALAAVTGGAASAATTAAGTPATAPVAAASAGNLLAPASGTRPDVVADPGAAPWRPVPTADVAKQCGLSPRLLKAAYPEMSITPFAVIRYGKLCWSGGTTKDLSETYEVNSEAKTFTALLFGIIAARTNVDENTLVRTWLTPGEMNVDLIGTALTQPPLNPNATVYNILTQTGQDPLLSYGLRLPWFYDAAGNFGMNSLVSLMDKVVRANPKAFPGAHSANDVAKLYLFKPLGMTATRWDGVVAAHTLYSNVWDMAKLGQLILRKGRWQGRQIVDEDYVYRMTHPEVEDVNTSYGYLTWMNAAKGAAALFGEKNDQTCEPYAGWRTYPHPPAYDAPSDNGGAPFHTRIDDGIAWADGSGGNFTEIHRGLDMVLIVKNDETAQKTDPASQQIGKENSTGLEYHRMWRILRPALVAQDPRYRGNVAAFCSAYRSSSYAPDLVSGWNARSGFGSVHLGRP
jgi:hypothetical protein